MASEARINIYADDRASATVKSVQGTLQRLAADAKTSILTGFGLGAGITAFAALSNVVHRAADALGGMVQAAIDDETSVRRLTAALHANVPGWDGNTDAIERTIVASQRLGFTDDETRASLAFLSAATNDVAKAQELHATAMDLARFKGISLQAASEALVKVESGRFRLLAGLGIQLREGATATEALAAVQAVAAGQAEEWGDSTAGALQSAQIAIEEAGEEIGRQLLPVVKELAEFARDVLVPALTAAFDAIQQVPWGEIADGIGLIVGAFNPASDALEHFSDEAEHMAEVSEASGRTTASNWTAMGLAILAANETTTTGVVTDWEDAKEDIAAAARSIPAEVAKAMIDGQKDVEAGVALLTQLLEDEWTDASRIAYLKGQLIVAQEGLAGGIAQGDSAAIAQARAVIEKIETELALLEGGAYEHGATAGLNLGYALTGTLPHVSQAARGLADGATGPLRGVEGSSYGIGQNTGWYYSQGLYSASSYVFTAAQYLANIVAHHLEFAGSPPYTRARKIGRKVAEAWGEGLSSELVRLPDISGLLGGATSGGFTSNLGVPAMAGAPIVLQVNLDGRQIAETVTREQYYMAPTTALYPKG